MIFFLQNTLPNQIEGFSRIEYLAVFNAIIFGFIVAEFFMGWGNFMRYRSQIHFDFIPVIWSFLTFLVSILIWWGTWTNNEFIGKNIYYYYYSLALPLLLYLVCVFLFPKVSDSRYEKDTFDLERYFQKQAPIISFLYGLLFTAMILNSIIFEEYEFWSIKNYIKGGAALLAFAGIIIKNRNYYWAITVIMFLLFVGFLITL
ncbi:hypothetical protein [Bernardetia sp.]|uniref:hypothetical protein n=1 Tax=Bernardetia sp. TaxID=1937974 RepID=UPI0025BDE193|nr:hypothetical protein [Bernardetia sp.]